MAMGRYCEESSGSLGSKADDRTPVPPIKFALFVR
jgi:hypothetical protein